ncbi:hypothetical protein GP486_008163 [Trichoglossum hirsutum]|uniref:Uncharacterized protein n=1 Tax=Trichoglossum hirsutum TaxID=265104 RepID=A0A9P8IGH0_9PEZI|nr:hypothetical protein GP486_008163 [Trichoglossum hirsutum]
MDGHVGPSESYVRAREHIEVLMCYSDSTVAVLPEAYWEEDFVVEMSEGEWARLCLDLDLGNEALGQRLRYLTCSYNSLTSTLTIHSLPSPLFRYFSRFIQEGFLDTRLHIPKSETRARIIRASVNLKYLSFGGEYRGSKKTPDLAVSFRDVDGILKLKLVVQVGFSGGEGYSRLIEDTRMWLEGAGREVSTVVLVGVEESPSYQSPILDLEGEEIEQLELSRQRRINFNAEGDFGPLTYKGLVWVGQITSVFMEIWKKDSQTGSAVGGDRMHLLPPASPPQLEFALREFTTVSLDEDVSVVFDWDDFTRGLKESIVELAELRYHRAIKYLWRRRMDARD